jgi:hypothetical protein
VEVLWPPWPPPLDDDVVVQLLEVVLVSPPQPGVASTSVDAKSDVPAIQKPRVRNAVFIHSSTPDDRSPRSGESAVAWKPAKNLTARGIRR